MEMRHYLILLITLQFGIGYGQQLQGVIVDAESNEPLEYASIGVVGKNVGSITQRNGEFTIDLSTAQLGDTVRFTYLGFKPVSILKESFDFAVRQRIALIPIDYEIEEVTINATAKIIVLGNDKASRRMTGWGDFESYRGRTRGLLISGAECPVKVKSFKFRINHNDWDSVAFRLNFLTRNENMLLTSILKENIIFHTDKKFHWVKVNLEKYNIIICNEVVVTLEWVDALGKTGAYSNLLTLSLSKNQGYVYNKEVSDEFELFEFQENAVAMFLEVFGD